MNSNCVSALTTTTLQEEEMITVLRADHPLANYKKVPLDALTKEPYILLDEEVINEPLIIFKQSD